MNKKITEEMRRKLNDLEKAARKACRDCRVDEVKAEERIRKSVDTTFDKAHTIIDEIRKAVKVGEGDLSEQFRRLDSIRDSLILASKRIADAKEECRAKRDELVRSFDAEKAAVLGNRFVVFKVQGQHGGAKPYSAHFLPEEAAQAARRLMNRDGGAPPCVLRPDGSWWPDWVKVA